MKKFIDIAKELDEETAAGDIAAVDSKLGKKVQKRKKPCKDLDDDDDCDKSKKMTEKIETPDDIIRDAGIKVKSVDMDDSSYVILLFKKSDTEKAKEILRKEGYEITIVGSMLYVH